MNSEQDRKRKRDGEGSASASLGADGADASQLSLMAEMKAALESNTSQMTQLQNKCQSMQNQIDGMATLSEKYIKMLIRDGDKVEDDCNDACNKLEERCNFLETRCDSLEKALHNYVVLTNTTKNNPNIEWTYSAPDIPSAHLEERGLEEGDIDVVNDFVGRMKNRTIRLRAAADEEESVAAVQLDLEGIGSTTSIVEHDDALLPHWKAFSRALYHNQCGTFVPMSFSLKNVELVSPVLDMLAFALRGKRINDLWFEENSFGDTNSGIAFVQQLLQHNRALTKFTWRINTFRNQRDVDSLAYALSRLNHIEHIEIEDSCDDNVDGYGLLCNLIADNRYLENLDFDLNNVYTLGDTKLFDLIASNPPLECLSLYGNYLDGDDISMLSEALKKNTTLITLGLGANDITDAGCKSLAEALGANCTLFSLNLRNNLITSEGCNVLERALFDQSTLNAVADSNHTCEVEEVDIEPFNSSENNRPNKIYRLLSSRHRECSNVFHLNKEMGEEECLNLVPKVLAIPALRKEIGQHDSMPLSIVYELLKNWMLIRW